MSDAELKSAILAELVKTVPVVEQIPKRSTVLSMFQKVIFALSKKHVIDVRLVVKNNPCIADGGYDPQDIVKAVRAAAQVLELYDPIVIHAEIKDFKVDELSDTETAAIARHMTTEKKS